MQGKPFSPKVFLAPLWSFGGGEQSPWSLSPLFFHSKPPKEEERRCPAKACERCRIRKARCSLDWPTCSRCKQMGLDCFYPATNTGLAGFIRMFSQRVNQASGRVLQLEQRWREIKTGLASRGIVRQSLGGGSDDAAASVRRLLGLPQNWAVTEGPKGVSVQTDLMNLSELMDFARHQLGRIKLPPDFEIFGGGGLAGGGGGVGGGGGGGGGAGGKIRGKRDGPARRRRKGIEIQVTFLRKYGLYSSPDDIAPILPLPPSPESTPASTACKDEEPDAHLDIPFYADSVEVVLRVMVECHFLYRVLDAKEFVASCRAGVLDPLMKWSIFAWTARHIINQHGEVPNRDRLQTFAQIAYEKAHALLSESFDEPRTATVVAALALHYYIIYDGRQSPYLGLARQHIDHLRTVGEDSEPFRRAAWAVTLMELLRAVFVDYSPVLDELRPEHEPRVLPGDNMETATCVECNIHGARALKVLADILQRKLDYDTEAVFAQDAERLLTERDRRRPPVMRVSVDAVTGVVLRYVAEYEIAYAAVHIQLYANILSEALRKWRRSEWSAVERRAHSVCKRYAHQIVDILSRLMEVGELCLISEQADPINVAAMVHKQLCLHSADSEERAEAFQYLTRSLAFLKVCASRQLLHMNKVLSAVETFVNEMEVESMSGAGPFAVENGMQFGTALANEQPFAPRLNGTLPGGHACWTNYI
ncbi:uncharacterized protein VTP21DRAFT_7979 [Calcarisporiella thermophila]|uniref:uncharacterized protein n=1 Tax=Calcarisporiella thermophila TaxID=911321 RepID=UPI0037447135